MRYTDIIGQYEAKQMVRLAVSEGRIPHALLLTGPEGCGKLPLALALAQTLLCQQPTAEGEPCGHCRNCRMAAQLAHPDLHLTFPIIRRKNAGSAEQVTCDQYVGAWRDMVTASPYVAWDRWLEAMGVENQQPIITVAEANAIISRLSLHASQGGRKVVVIWHAELMNEQAANKLLKTLEEPTPDTHFILTTSQPRRLLETIRSRTQCITLRPLGEQQIADALTARHGLDANTAKMLAHNAEGSYTRACAMLGVEEETAEFFDLFVLIMRKCFQSDVKSMYQWADRIAAWGRERQKAFLAYCQRLVRENFMANFHLDDLTYMNAREADFSTRFARFVNERNVIGFMAQLDDAYREIQQNVNARMVFFDLAMQMALLVRR